MGFVNAPSDGYVTAVDLLRSGILPWKSWQTLKKKIEAGEFPPPVSLGARKTSFRWSYVHKWVADTAAQAPQRPIAPPKPRPAVTRPAEQHEAEAA